eukprot:scaffold67293_cov42-Prasinocladus_malaysianus.AAC.3
MHVGQRNCRPEIHRVEAPPATESERCTIICQLSDITARHQVHSIIPSSRSIGPCLLYVEVAVAQKGDKRLFVKASFAVGDECLRVRAAQRGNRLEQRLIALRLVDTI